MKIASLIKKGKKIDLKLIQLIFHRLNGKSKSGVQIRPHLETIFASTLWSIGILVIALPNGLKTKIGSIGLPNDATPEQIRKAWGPGDAGSLMDTALTWAKFHHIDPTTQYWIVHLWTPGMSILEIPLIWLAKIGIPIFWSLLLITAVIWCLIFFLAWKYISALIGRIYLSLIFLILLFSWDFEYIFRFSIFYTEGISLGLLLLGLGILTYALIVKIQNYKTFFISGLLLGCSLMIRYVSDYALTSAFILSLFLVFYWNFRRNKSRGKYSKVSLSKVMTKNSLNQIPLNIRSVFISTATAIAITLPWRVIGHYFYGNPHWLMSTAARGTGISLWIPNSKNFYWAFSDMNWACKIDPFKCERLSKLPLTTKNDSLNLLEAIKTALSHPASYLKDRGSFVENLWVPGGLHHGPLLQVFCSIFPLLLIIPTIILILRDKGWTNALMLWMPFLVFDLGQLFIIHFESRYFIPVRFILIGVFLFVLLNTEVMKSSQVSNPQVLSKVHL